MKEGVPDDVEPATISEVLLEVVYCHHADLSRQPVVDFLDDVILGFHDQFFYASCIHWLCVYRPCGKPQGTVAI